MGSFIKGYVEGCATCQQNKVLTHPIRPALNPIDGPKDTRPFANISIDFITKLPISESYDAIMVVVDHGSSKGGIYTPCNETIDAIGTADLLLRNVYRRFGMWDSILSDRGPQFASQVMKELYRIIKVDRKMSTAYHPQTDGETERVNQELEGYLRIFCANNPESWASHLHMAEFAHNSKEHSA